MQSRHSKLFSLRVPSGVPYYETFLFVQPRHSKLYCLCNRDIRNFMVCAIEPFETLLLALSLLGLRTFLVCIYLLTFLATEPDPITSHVSHPWCPGAPRAKPPKDWFIFQTRIRTSSRRYVGHMFVNHWMKTVHWYKKLNLEMPQFSSTWSTVLLCYLTALLPLQVSLNVTPRQLHGIHPMQKTFKSFIATDLYTDPMM